MPPTEPASRTSVKLSSRRLNHGEQDEGPAISSSGLRPQRSGACSTNSLEIIPADAAHDETWNFLTLVVFPDVAVQRFPDMHVDRMIGTPRNVLGTDLVPRGGHRGPAAFSHAAARRRRARRPLRANCPREEPHARSQAGRHGPGVRGNGHDRNGRVICTST